MFTVQKMYIKSLEINQFWDLYGNQTKNILSNEKIFFLFYLRNILAKQIKTVSLINY